MRNIFLNPIVLSSLAVTAIIAAGSGAYYYHASHMPLPTPIVATTSVETVTGSGVVESAENPDLAFQTSGKIVSIRTAVGKHVSSGQTLASLDTVSLYAERAQASANLKAQSAKLDEMRVGARTVDVAAKQTAVDQAKTALLNLYASSPANIAQAYDKSFSGVSADTDTLFNQPNSDSPSLGFVTSNTQAGIDAASARSSANGELPRWKTEVSSLNVAPDQVDAVFTSSLSHLSHVRTFADLLLEALSSAVATTNFTQTQISAGQTSVTALRDAVNAQILSLQGIEQQIASAKLAISAAQNALDQVASGSTPQAIEAQEAQVESAQASVQAVDAQINNEIIVAPFSGSVSSVQAKVGDTVLSGAPVITLNPESALQITVFLTEIDVAKINVGDSADVTLDAYGTGRHWSATVVSIDHSPTTRGATTGFKTVLQFASSDPAVSPGMNANVTIPLKK